MISTVDPDARHVHKTVHRRQDGYKAHLAVEPDTGIITDCALTKANGADNHEAAVGLRLLETENSPVTVLADSAYGAGDFRAELADQGHIDRVKPAPNRRVIPGGFTIDDFTVDHAAERDLPERVNPSDQPHRICHFWHRLRGLPAARPMHPQSQGQETRSRPR